jgi:excisionase family DNA binding protein
MPNLPNLVDNLEMSPRFRQQLLDLLSEALVNAPKQPWPRWMTTETCAAYIDRTVHGVRALVKRGSIPFVKQGGTLYFDRDAIDDWIATGWLRTRRR